MKRRPAPAQELRAAIDRLPAEIRRGILAGIGRRTILAGAHRDSFGGACPMVAAEVRWEEVDRACIAVAQEVAWAWDRYAEATTASRAATGRQLLALKAMLEASLLEDDAADRRRQREIPGRRWTVPVRSWSDYERTLGELDPSGVVRAVLAGSGVDRVSEPVLGR